MADFLVNALRAARLLPEPIDADAAIADTNEIAYRPLPNPYELGFKQGLLEQKYNWDSAAQAIKEAENRYQSAEEMLKTAGLTDEQIKQYTGEKARAQADILTAKNIQEQSHSMADYTRDLAKKMGLDLSNYDANNTSLRDATMNLTAETNNAIKNFMKSDMEPSEYYDRVYRDLLNAGAPMRQAQQEAARRAEKYSIDRQARYNTMLNMYGNNGDGTMNSTGVELLGRILNQAPEMANYYNTMWANPQKQYSDTFQAAKEQAARNDAAAQQILMANLNHENALDKLLKQYIYNAKQLEQQQGYRQSNIKLQGTVNDINNARSQERQFEYDRQKAAQAQAYRKDLVNYRAQLNAALKENDINKALAIYQGKLELNKKYGINNNEKKSEETMKQKIDNLKSLQALYDDYLIEHPEATGSANKYYDRLTEVEDEVLGRFEGDPSNYNVAWSWITDFMEKFANDKGQKASREDVQAFAKAHFPEWIATDIIKTLENNDYNGYTAD